MFVPLRVKLDMVEQFQINTGYTLVRNDYNSCDLIVEVAEQGQLIDDLSGYSATIIVKRADNVIVNNFMVVGDTLSIKLPNNMYSADGEVVANISLYKDGAKKTLQPFTFKVREDINADEVIDGDVRIGVLDTLIEETQVLKAGLDEVTSSANEATQRANVISENLENKVNSGYYKGETGEQGEQGIKGEPGTFWTGTQAEYDAIPAKDADTLYFISG